VTQARAELRRQLRAVRNVHLLGHLVRTAANLPVHPEAAARLRRYRLPNWTSGRSKAEWKADLVERDRQFRIAPPAGVSDQGKRT
jgi:hypothetical protein